MALDQYALHDRTQDSRTHSQINLSCSRWGRFFHFPALSFGLNIYMASYSVNANSVSQSTPVLARGPITITAQVNVFWRVGENPQADDRCALLRAGTSLQLRIPVKCSRIAFLAVKDAGWVTVHEVNGTKASCSS
jgi:hypothetical protein